MPIAIGLTCLKSPGVLISSSAKLPVEAPSIGVLCLAASSAILGLFILSRVITILRDCFSASGDRSRLELSAFLLSFLCFCFGVCIGLVIANAMICSMSAVGRNSGAGRGLFEAMQMLFGRVAGSAIIALGGPDHSSVTATGLLIMTLYSVSPYFLAFNSR